MMYHEPSENGSSTMNPDPALPRTAALTSADSLRQELEQQVSGETRFDAVSRVLYSTDASVYQIQPLGVVLPRTTDDIVQVVRICGRHGVPITARGGGTSQAGQAIGSGVVLDTSKYLNRILEVNASERWARVEPGVVLDQLNVTLRPHGLRFAPDISTASRATIGGMMANNSSGARSLVYGKTIDHVLEQRVVLADGSIAHFRVLSADELDAASTGDTLEANAYRMVRELAATHRDEIDRRFPKILRRVGGYNLDAFVGDQPFNLCKLMVGSEGTLGVVVEAKIKLVPLPKAKAVLAIHFADLLQSLAAVPAILEHHPVAIEVMDNFILNHTRENPAFERMRDFIVGDPGALLVVEFYGDTDDLLGPRLDALEKDLAGRHFGYHFHRALDPKSQAKIWNLREAALGLSMAMKGDAKSLSFVEDTAVAPEKLRDYIERFLALIHRHGTTAGVYAHASVGCLHVRPVIDLKTSEGIERFESIANGSADLVLEFGGAISGEHGDGLVRTPFVRKMFGDELYGAFRAIKKQFDPAGIFNPSKIVDPVSLTANLRYGAEYKTADPPTFFDYSEYGGVVRAVEMCSGLGVCRKKLDGTMCPSYMATREEAHSTRGRANVLRLAMNGTPGAMPLAAKDVYAVLDLCLECRACRSECPVGVDMARFKSEFLASYWASNGTPWRARMFGAIDRMSRWGSRFAPVSNWVMANSGVRYLSERLIHLDRRRRFPQWKRHTFEDWSKANAPAQQANSVLLFNDTFTNHFDPEIGIGATQVLNSIGHKVGVLPYHCCGRPLISQGLLEQARARARETTEAFYSAALAGKHIVFCEPSCLSAVREDLPGLLRGELREQADLVASQCVLFEEFMEGELRSGNSPLNFTPGPRKLLLHGHCHQKSMGLLAPALALLSRIPGTSVVDLDAGCCGMAGSFGYLREHYDVSRQIGERKLLPAVRNADEGTVVIAGGTSCRHQVMDFTGRVAVHPAILLRDHIRPAPISVEPAFPSQDLSTVSSSIR